MAEKLELEPLELEPVESEKEALQLEPLELEEITEEKPSLISQIPVVRQIAEAPKQIYEAGKGLYEQAFAPPSADALSQVSDEDVNIELERMKRDEPGAPELQMSGGKDVIKRKLAERKASSGAGEALIKGAAAGASPVGIAYQPAAAVEKAIGKLDPTLSPEAYQAMYGDRSTEELAEANKQRDIQLAQEHPVASTVGMGLGVSAPVGAVSKAIKGATAPLLAGSALAGSQTTTKEFEETSDLPEAIGKGLETAATSAVLGKGAELGGKFLTKKAGQVAEDVSQLEKPLREASYTQRVKALKPKPSKEFDLIRKEIKDTIQKRKREMQNTPLYGDESAEIEINDLVNQLPDEALENFDLEAYQKMGRVLDEENIRGSHFEQKKQIESKKALYGAQNEITLKSLEDAGNKLPEAIRQQSRVNTQNIFNQADGLIKELKASPDLLNLQPKLRTILEKIEYPGELSLTEANQLVKDLDEIAGWQKATANPYQQQVRKVRRIVNQSVDSTAEKVSQLTNKPNTYKAFQKSNERFGVLNEASKLSSTGTNKLSTAEDILLGLALPGSLLTGPFAPLTAGVAVGRFVGKRYGRQIAAGTLKKLANTAKASPEVFGKYADKLNRAAERGAASLAATNYILSQQDPEYRELIDNLTKDEEDESQP